MCKGCFESAEDLDRFKAGLREVREECPPKAPSNLPAWLNPPPPCPICGWPESQCYCPADLKGRHLHK